LALPLIAYISVRSAAHPVPLSFEQALQTASEFFAVSCIAGFAFCYPGDDQRLWARAVIGGGFMLAASAVAYSYVRQEIILMPLPGLFCLSGSALGGCAGLTISALVGRTRSGKPQATQERAFDRP